MAQESSPSVGSQPPPDQEDLAAAATPSTAGRGEVKDHNHRSDHRAISIPNATTESHAAASEETEDTIRPPPPNSISSSGRSVLLGYLSALRGTSTDSSSTGSPTTTTFLSTFSSTTIFSFAMTISFIGVLWIVVIVVFGYRGHAIAGGFVAMFLVGLLINSFFLKLYFKFRILVASRSNGQCGQETTNETQVTRRWTKEEEEERPPSYASVVELPPPYNFLRFYKQQRKLSKMSNSSSSSSSTKEETMNKTTKMKCPLCRSRLEEDFFGICASCERDLT